MEINFTKRSIEACASPDKGAIYYYDTKTRGLGIRITATGVKTFVFYRWINKKPERITIGRFPDISPEQARGIASHYNAAIARGENPATALKKKQTEWTLSDAFNAYIERHAKHHNKTWMEEIKNYNRYLKHWSNKKLSSITRSDIQRLHIRLGADNGHVTANRTLELVRVIFNKAIFWERFTMTNPSIGITKYKVQSRERFLQPNEIERFMKALSEEDNETARDVFLICLFTGARKSNVLAMQWNEIDFDNQLWRIPDTKNGTPHVVPLIQEAIRVLHLRQKLSKGSYVFPGREANSHLVNPNKAWKRILQRAQIKDLRIHDLRRTMGSWQAMTGTALPIIGKTLAHKNIATTAIYARLNHAPVRESMDKAMTELLKNGRQPLSML
jgi:integrase